MDKILSEFGINIKRHRLKNNLSQEKLAEIAGLHRTYIGQVEAGKRNIALKNIVKLSKALKVEVRNLFNK